MRGQNKNSSTKKGHSKCWVILQGKGTFDKEKYSMSTKLANFSDNKNHVTNQSYFKGKGLLTSGQSNKG